MSSPNQERSESQPVSMAPVREGEQSTSNTLHINRSRDGLRVANGSIAKTNSSRDHAALQRLLPHIRDMLTRRTESIVNSIDTLSKKVDAVMVLLDHTNGLGVSGKGLVKPDSENKLDSLTPHLNFVFSQQRIADVLQIVVFVYLTKLMEGESSVPHAAASALQVIQFAIQPHDTKSVYSTPVGKHFTTFRKTMVSSLIVNAQSNRFDVFIDDDDGAEVVGDVASLQQSVPSSGRRSEQINVSEDGVAHSGKITHPEWLKKGFITPAHVTEAADLIESGGRSTKSKKSIGRGTPRAFRGGVQSKQEIAVHGACRIFKAVNSMFHHARENFKVAFFEELGYLLVPWVQYGVSLNQRTASLDWLSCSAPSPLEISHVPACENTVKKNEKIAREFLRDHKDMVLKVRHDVQIRKGGPNSKAMEGPSRRIFRAVNLVVVAARMLASFSGAGDVTKIEDVMLLHGSVLKSSFGLAVVLRSVVEECKRNLTDSVMVGDDNSYDPTKISTMDITLQSLLPTPTNKDRLLRKRCLLMTLGRYEHLNMSFSTIQEMEMPILDEPGDDIDGSGELLITEFDDNVVHLL